MISNSSSLISLKINMDLAYDKMTLDQTNTYAQGYLNIVNSNMPAEVDDALSGVGRYGFLMEQQPIQPVVCLHCRKLVAANG